jgi:DNA-binding SARP family transcriptional activator
VLGPVAAWGADAVALDLKGPRHRAVLARLAVARGRVVPLGVLIEDLWEEPPAGAAGAIRTFVGALRRAIEPGRPARTGFQVLVTQGPGYALRTGPGDLDALEFGRLAAEAAAAPPHRVLELYDESAAAAAAAPARRRLRPRRSRAALVIPGSSPSPSTESGCSPSRRLGAPGRATRSAPRS